MKKTSLLLALILCVSVIGCDKATDGTTEETQEMVSEPIGEMDMGWVKNIDGAKSSNHSSAVVEADECFYYVSGSGVVKVDKLTGKEKLIAENGGDIYSDYEAIALYEGQLYCSDSYTIRRYIAEEERVEEVWKIPEDFDRIGLDMIYGFTIADGYIYVRDSGISVLEIDLKNGRTERLLGDYNGYAIIEESVYFVSHAQKDFTIYKLDRTTGQSEKVRGEGISHPDSAEITMYDDVVEVDGLLYYTTRFPFKLYRYSEDGNDEVIVDIEVNDHLRLSLGQKYQDSFTYEITDSSKHTKDIYLYSATGSKYIGTVDFFAEYYLTDNYLFYLPNEDSEFHYITVDRDIEATEPITESVTETPTQPTEEATLDATEPTIEPTDPPFDVTSAEDYDYICEMAQSDVRFGWVKAFIEKDVTACADMMQIFDKSVWGEREYKYYEWFEYLNLIEFGGYSVELVRDDSGSETLYFNFEIVNSDYDAFPVGTYRYGVYEGMMSKVSWERVDQAPPEMDEWFADNMRVYSYILTLDKDSEYWKNASDAIYLHVYKNNEKLGLISEGVISNELLQADALTAFGIEDFIPSDGFAVPVDGGYAMRGRGGPMSQYRVDKVEMNGDKTDIYVQLYADPIDTVKSYYVKYSFEKTEGKYPYKLLSVDIIDKGVYKPYYWSV